MTFDPYTQQSFNPYNQYDEQYKTFDQKPTFPSAHTDIRVEKVIFVPTGTYNQQYRRPWVTEYNRDNANAVQEVVAAAYHQYQQAKSSGRVDAAAKYMVDPMDLAGVSSSFIKPSADFETMAQANHHGGWEMQTGRFMMVLNVQRHQAVTPTRYVVIGYTNYLGFTQQQHIDPTMELTVNTIFEIRETAVNRGYGLVTERQMVAVNQVLLDQHFSNPDEARMIRMRPSEVATALARMTDPQLQSPGLDVVDTRYIQNGTPQFSDQHHTNPNDYMAKVLTGLVNGRDQAIQTNRTGAIDPYHQALRQLRDVQAQTDPFIRAISNVGGGTTTATFKWRDLLRIDPNAERDEVCVIQWRDRTQFVGAVNENMHMTGNTSQWHGNDLSTQTATQITNLLPSLMSDLALRKVSIFASNLAAGQAICIATAPVGIIGGVDMTPQLQALQTMFYQQLVMPSTFNGGISYEMNIDADLFGEISVRLKLDRLGEEWFVQPAYCSSVMTPVITTKSDVLDNLATAFHNIQNDVLPANVQQPLMFDMVAGTPTGRRY